MIIIKHTTRLRILKQYIETCMDTGVAKITFQVGAAGQKYTAGTERSMLAGPL